MDWLHNVALVTVAINAVMIGWNSHVMRRNTRLHAQLTAADELLTQLCVASFIRHLEPVWQAWAETMGSIRLRVVAVRKAWADGP